MNIGAVCTLNTYENTHESTLCHASEQIFGLVNSECENSHKHNYVIIYYS